MDCLHLPDVDWRGEHNWCNPPWELLNDLAVKLGQSGAAATIISPYWSNKAWYAHLSDMASESIIMPPATTYSLHKSGMDEWGVGPSTWGVVAFRLPLRRGCC